MAESNNLKVNFSDDSAVVSGGTLSLTLDGFKSLLGLKADLEIYIHCCRKHLDITVIRKGESPTLPVIPADNRPDEITLEQAREEAPTIEDFVRSEAQKGLDSLDIYITGSGTTVPDSPADFSESDIEADAQILQSASEKCCDQKVATESQAKTIAPPVWLTPDGRRYVLGRFQQAHQDLPEAEAGNET